MTSAEPAIALSPLPKGRFGASRLVQWCAAQQNWDRIHFDQSFARASGLRDCVVNGALKQHLLVQFLERAFEHRAWIWRLDFSFLSPDWVNETLEVRGRLVEARRSGPFELLRVDLEIWNVDQSLASTLAQAVVIRETGTSGPLLALPQAELPGEWGLDQRLGAPGPDLDADVAARIGTIIEAERSHYRLDLSRLRLFAEAVGDCPAFQFDPANGAASAYGAVVAPVLFPIHAIELPPGARPLGTSVTSTGREASSEIGRHLGARLGLASGPALNGGSSVEIHSPLLVGESVQAESRLADVRFREGRRGGRLLIIESLNEYRVTGSERLLLRERSRGVYTGAGSGGCSPNTTNPDRSAQAKT
jgi:acyl dehydratase